MSFFVRERVAYSELRRPENVPTGKTKTVMDRRELGVVATEVEHEQRIRHFRCNCHCIPMYQLIVLSPSQDDFQSLPFQRFDEAFLCD